MFNARLINRHRMNRNIRRELEQLVRERANFRQDQVPAAAAVLQDEQPRHEELGEDALPLPAVDDLESQPASPVRSIISGQEQDDGSSSSYSEHDHMIDSEIDAATPASLPSDRSTSPASDMEEELLNDQNFGAERQEDVLTDEQLSDRLCQIAEQTGLNHAQVRAVAKLLRDAGHNIRADPRSILRTSRATVGDVDFVHLGVIEGIKRKIHKGLSSTSTGGEIFIQMNADGFPLFKNNTIELWAWSCRVLNSKDTRPFLVSIRKGKPPAGQVGREGFFRPGLNELKVLENEGLTLEDGRHFIVKFVSFPCDAPARQLAKAMKGHCGYGACERCNQKGVYINQYRCMTFPELERFLLRTDASFRNKTDRRHHDGTSPFEELRNIDMIHTFPLDYMHLVLQGVFKRLLQIWTGEWNKNWTEHSLRREKLHLINKRLRRIRKSYPSEFHRYPTKLKPVGNWKATELRSLLLYTGPVILKGAISDQRFQHFMYLHIGIRLLASPVELLGQQGDSNRIANDCLKYFSYRFGEIYGKNHLIYNVHSLIHLAGECSVHGPLDQFSTFPYETFLYKLKRLVRSSNRPLAQIVKRISELDYASGLTKDVWPSMFNEIAPDDLITRLKVGTRKDSYYMTECGRIVKVMGRNDDYTSFIPFKPLRNLYREPIKSKRLQIFQSDGLEDGIQVQSNPEIKLKQKCWIIPMRSGGCAIFPLMHSAG